MYALFGFENRAEASNTLQKMISLFLQDRSRTQVCIAPGQQCTFAGDEPQNSWVQGKKALPGVE